MTKQINKSHLATAMGAALIGSLALGGAVQAGANPFGMTELDGGYMQLAMNEGKCGGEKTSTEGKCGGEKAAKEAKCGADKAVKEGKCGADKKAKEGSCGEGKSKPKAAEGKCGEAKCGANK